MPSSNFGTEIAEKVQAAAGLAVAARAVGLADHRRMLAAHATRVDQSHKAMAKAAGMGDLVPETLSESDDTMGDIVVTGDIYNTAPSPEPRPARPANKMPWWLKAAFGGLLLASGGSLGAGLTGYFLTPGASVDTDTQFELRLGGVE